MGILSLLSPFFTHNSPKPNPLYNGTNAITDRLTTVCSKLSELSLNASKGEPTESDGTAREGFASTTPSKREGKLKSSSPSPTMGYTPLKFKQMPGQDPTPSPKTLAMSMS